MKPVTILTALIITVLLSVFMASCTDQSSLSGTVTWRDSGGAAQGVSVILFNASDNATMDITATAVDYTIVTTDEDGTYTFTNLRAGSYIVFAALEGYVFDPATRQVEVQGVTVDIDFAGYEDEPDAPPNDPITCYSVEAEDPNVCSGNGTCVSFNNCECDAGYYGDECDDDTKPLPTYTKNNKMVVSGRFSYPDPCFGDLDADGDMDLVVGNYYGIFQYYEYSHITTSGHILFYEQHGDDNPFFGIDVGDYSSPCLADVDGDGDLDMISGHRSNNAGIIYFENIGTAQKPQFEQRSADNSPFGHIFAADATLPSMADLDNDGDPDLMVGFTTSYYENTGTAQNPIFERVDNDLSPLKGVRDYYFFSPTFGDTDNDGDLDLIAGYYSYSNARELYIHYDNIGTKENPLFSYYDYLRNDEDAMLLCNPALVDINQDGVLDIIYGKGSGLIELKGSLH